MPSRPVQHVVGDLAVVEVLRIVSLAGHAAEQVLKDYGEDILVQTSWRGTLDPSRIWIQVKGTQDIQRLKLRDGRLRVKVKRNQALRWVRSLDKTILVLWSVREGRGWFVDTAEIPESEILEAASAHVSVYLDQTAEFTADNFNVLVWETRMDYYDILIRYRHASLEDADEVDSTDRYAYRQSTTMVILSFLLLVGVMEQKGNRFTVSEAAWDVIVRELTSDVSSMVEELSRSGTDRGQVIHDRFLKAAVIAVLEVAQSAGVSCGLPEQVLIHASLSLFKIHEKMTSARSEILKIFEG